MCHIYVSRLQDFKQRHPQRIRYLWRILSAYRCGYKIIWFSYFLLITYEGSQMEFRSLLCCAPGCNLDGDWALCACQAFIASNAKHIRCWQRVLLLSEVGDISVGAVFSCLVPFGI